MKAKHRKTLQLIFQRPTCGSIRWADIEALFIALGAGITEAEGSRLCVRLFNDRRVFHRPHPSPDTDKGAVSSIRKWLEENGGNTMKNVMEFEGGYQAVITYDPEIEMFRGEFVGLNGGADFYARDADSLKREGKTSLDVFLRMCTEDGVSPRKVQGKFALRLPPDVYHSATVAAAAEGKSLNAFITEAVRQTVRLRQRGHI